MSKKNELAKESMKTLTQKVMQADIASRKNKMLNHRGAIVFRTLVVGPLVFYSLYNLFTYNGPVHQVMYQRGEWVDSMAYMICSGAQSYSIRQRFRPEIYNKLVLIEMENRGKIAEEFIHKSGSNIKFNSYVWH